MRDISSVSFFMRSSAGGLDKSSQIEKRKLKDLAGEFLNAGIQMGHHSSIIDARVALALYRTYQMEIEAEFGTEMAVAPRTSETIEIPERGPEIQSLIEKYVTEICSNSK